MTDEKSRDYARGYTAGRRKAETDEREESRRHSLHMARYALAAAIAPEIIHRPWQNNGVSLNTTKGVAGTVADLVLEIERKLR